MDIIDPVFGEVDEELTKEMFKARLREVTRHLEQTLATQKAEIDSLKQQLEVSKVKILEREDSTTSLTTKLFTTT